MQPYRQAAPNSYLPIYWEYRQCSCPACISSQGNESNATSTSNEVRRPSFTIDYLLSDEEQKPFKQRATVPSLPVQCVSHTPDHFPKDGAHTPYHSGFVANFSRPSQFSMENMPLMGSGSIQSEGPFLPHSEESDWPHQKPKRMRTIFTVEQLERLEREFTRQQYMVGGQRFYLSKELGLTETQVKVWFQNRRIKWRKQIIEQQRSKVRHHLETSTNTLEETHGS